MLLFSQEFSSTIIVTRKWRGRQIVSYCMKSGAELTLRYTYKVAEVSLEELQRLLLRSLPQKTWGTRVVL